MSDSYGEYLGERIPVFPELLGCDTPELKNQSAQQHPDMPAAPEVAKIGGDDGWEEEFYRQNPNFAPGSFEGMSESEIAALLLASDDRVREQQEFASNIGRQSDIRSATVMAFETDGTSNDGSADLYPNRYAAGSWQKRAFCVNDDPEILFNHEIEGIDEESVRVATAIARRNCIKCVVQLECLNAALGDELFDGIYGGLTQAERKELAARNPEGMNRGQLAKAIEHKLKLDERRIRSIQKARVKTAQQSS